MRVTRMSAAFRCATMLALATSGSGAVAADAPPWKIRIPAHASIGNAPLADTHYEFACTTGKGGAISLTLVMPAPEDVKGFPLEDFEGPDGVGGTHKLAEWSVSAKKPQRARTPISGWRGVDGDGFLLSTARESARPSDIARIARRLLSSEEARLRLVVKPLKGGAALKVEAPIAGHREAVGKVLGPCLTGVK